MKKIAIVITIIVVASCKEKSIEIPKNKLADEVVNKAAMADIANQLQALDNNVIIARDTTKNAIYRSIAVDKIRRSGAVYLDSLTTENIFCADFARRLESQKQLIISNCRQIIRTRQYTQLVIAQPK
jgi:hypothetical protein